MCGCSNSSCKCVTFRASGKFRGIYQTNSKERIRYVNKPVTFTCDCVNSFFQILNVDFELQKNYLKVFFYLNYFIYCKINIKKFNCVLS